jgi:dTDP-4-dehydrorhamnose reductase
MLGHKLFQTLRESFDAFVTLRAGGPPWQGYPFDPDRGRGVGGVEATDPDSVAAAIDRARPEAVINCIGIVKQRAAAPTRSSRCDQCGVPPLLRLCGDRGCRLIHISTDCVFNGRGGSCTEDDEPDPMTYAAASCSARSRARAV